MKNLPKIIWLISSRITAPVYQTPKTLCLPPKEKKKKTAGEDKAERLQVWTTGGTKRYNVIFKKKNIQIGSLKRGFLKD